VANFTADPQRAVLDAPPEAGQIDGRPVRREGEMTVLAPYQHLWIRGHAGAA
jgi:hypothetical protein